MYTSTIFGQLLQFVPKYSLTRIINKYQADKHISKCSTWNQLVILLYAQATKKESLRDIETGLYTHAQVWKHLGINTVARSTIAEMNQKRDYRVFEELFYVMLARCRDLTQTRTFSFKNPLYSLDSTMIDLCLSLCDWAHYRTGKGAIKIHTLLDNRTLLPELLVITVGKHHDGTIARECMQAIYGLEPGSIVVFDRAYIDFKWWDTLDRNDLYFVSRIKQNQLITVNERRSSRVTGSVLQDDLVYIGDVTTLLYPKRIRLITVVTDEGKQYTYVTNNDTLSASEIALVYKERWQIELFFKWIKQNLKIKRFFGTSPNAVLSQVWIAMIYYLLLMYIHFQTNHQGSLLEFTRLVRETLLVRRPLIDLLSLNTETLAQLDTERMQETLF
jgi:hypothetical protein